ncbi:MAG: outer rane efflux protein [Sedimentibacter sp.]|nr:outer rane efflux protein [Sedimentibacter sp.]
MKRKISLLLAMILILSTLTNVALAVDSMPVSAEAEIIKAEDKVMELSIEEAVKLAIESDRGMWKIDKTIGELQDARRLGSSAKELYEQLTEAPMIPGSSDLNYFNLILSKNDYYSKTAELKTKELQKGREQMLKGIEINTISLYYKTLVAEKTIGINQAKLDKANEQLRVINLKFNNGSETKAGVLRGEMAVQEAKTELNTAMDDLNIVKLDLLNLLNLPFDTSIVLTDTELTYVPTVELNLDAALEKAKTERLEIISAQNNLELQKIETHAYKAYYTSNLWQNKVAVKKLEDAELNVPQAYKDVELDVRKTYLNLVKAERALVNMDKTVELSKEAARINKLLYENGMATSLEVLEADTNLAQAEIGRYQLLVAYNLSKLMFDNSNLMGSPVSAEE